MSDAAKAKPARPKTTRKRDAETGRLEPFEPTPEQRALVRRMAGIGMRQDEIVHCVPWPDGRVIDPDTLRKHFGAELAQGKALKGMKLKQRAFEMAEEGDRAMLQFVLRTQYGWSETTTVQTVDEKGNPAPITGGPATQVHYYLPRKNPLPTVAEALARKSGRKASRTRKEAA